MSEENEQYQDPKFIPINPGQAPEGEPEFRLHFKGLPPGVGIQRVLGMAPFVCLEVVRGPADLNVDHDEFEARDRTKDVIHIGIVSGGQVEGEADTEREAVRNIARVMREAATALEQGTTFALDQEDAEAATLSAYEEEMLNEALADLSTLGKDTEEGSDG